MKGVYVQRNSPYYWIRYYDKHEPDSSKKRKSYNTKIEITPSDYERIKKSEKIVGTPKLREQLKDFKIALAQRNLEATTGIKIKKDLKLSEGFREFKDLRSVPGSKKQVKKKTLINYDLAVRHMISSCGDKKIYKYTEKKDYINLLHYFEQRDLSRNSRSIYTRALKTLWKYFVEQSYTVKNIIEAVEQEEKDPEPILLEDIYTIIQYLKTDDKSPHHYWIIYFMLLTGCRPSSAIVQLKEDIDFNRKRITIKNVKTGSSKGKQFYRFPLYNELNKLIKEMKINSGDTGRLFDMFSVVPAYYTWPLSFWNRKIKFLLAAKKIEKRYTLKQIRPTLASFLINVLKMDIFIVKKLLDHANIKITDKNYVDFNVNVARKELDDITLESFLEEEF